MKDEKKVFPLMPIGRIAKKAGAKRISKDALEKIRDATLERAEEIALEAVALARHAGRITVQAKDVQMAAKK